MQKGFILLAALCAGAGRGYAQVPEWKLVEEWRVGGDPSGGNAFDANIGFAKLPSGGFVHLDWQARQMFLLDARGKPVRTIGRPGEGPGEFSRPAGLTVARDGRIVVNDLTNGLLLFAADGKFIRAFRVQRPYFPTGNFWNATMQPDGRLFESLRLNPSQNAGRNEVRLLWNVDLSKFDTLPLSTCGSRGATSPATVPLKDASGKVLLNMPLLLVEPTYSTAYGNDGYVWEATPRSGNVFTRHKLLDCTPVATATLADSRTPVGPAERALLDTLVRAEAKRWKVAPPDMSVIPRDQAWFQNACTDDQGNLWVERVVGPKADTRIDIFSRDGKAIGVIRRGMLAVSRISGGYLYGFASDDDGVRYLVAYRIVRPQER